MCSSNQDYLKDGWNFLKMHLIKHLFDDIVAKGVTQNYSTKPFEKMHCVLHTLGRGSGESSRV